ncbi:MAG TPA: hypothetical protein VHG71_12600 [Verrucomicrobiae bacterium]|nr:hypothetical protein [Verrucomicrobiae bacterium]
MAEVIFQFVITLIIVVFALFAVVNLCLWMAVIPSLIWLAFVVMCIKSSARRDGGLQPFLVNVIGDLFGKKFVEWNPNDLQSRCIRFGFQLLGHRFIQKSIQLNKIESISWHTGQASGMAGRDVNDWKVWMYCDSGLEKPNHINYGIGPAVRKSRTEALGLSLISFLRNAGVNLVQADVPNCYVRPT